MPKNLAIGSLRSSFRATTPWSPLAWMSSNMEMLWKSLIGFIIFVFGISVPSLLMSQENLSEIVKRVKPSTVVILTYDKGGKALSQGSGFFISREGDVITNRHVLQGAIKAEIKTTKGNTYPVKQVVAEDIEGDIIRVSVDIPSGVAIPLKLSVSLPEEGERIIVIGNPLGLEQTISDGIVSAIREIPGYGKIVQITAPISPGSSGSPVINTKGEVAGIATFLVREGQNLNFAIPQERLAKLLPGSGYALAEWEAGRLAGQAIPAEESYLKGIKYLWVEDYEKALGCFEATVKNNPTNAEAYFQIGDCSHRLRRFQEAMEAFIQAIRIKPNWAEAHYNLGVIFYELTLYQDAEGAFRQAIRIKPDFADAYNNLGVSYKNRGLYQEAVEAYKQAIRIKPALAAAYHNLGVSCLQLGRYQEALEASKQAIQIEPDYAEAHSSLGIIYGVLGRYREAVEAHKQAIRIKPDFAGAHFGLGMTYLMLQEKVLALDEYRILIELDAGLANKLFSAIYK